MKMRAVVLGAFVWVVAVASAGCSSDASTLVKWSCSCGDDACASTESDAESLSSDQCGTNGNCSTTGDICACPGGGSKCAILLR